MNSSTMEIEILTDNILNANNRLKCGEIVFDSSKILFECKLCGAIFEVLEKGFFQHLLHHLNNEYIDNYTDNCSSSVGDLENSLENITASKFSSNNSNNSEDNHPECILEKIEEVFCDENNDFEILEDSEIQKYEQFYCPVIGCSNYTNTKKEIFLHMHNDHNLVQQNGSDDYKCSICEKQYFKRELAKRHLKKDHNILTTITIDDFEDENFNCVKCEKNYKSKETLICHIRVCHNEYFNGLLVEEQLKFEATHLKYSTDYMKTNEIMKNIKIDRQDNYDSEESNCFMESSFYDERNNTVDQTKTGDEFFCPIGACQNIAKTTSDMFLHIHECHELIQCNGINYQCCVCLKPYSRREFVKKHLKKEHNIHSTITLLLNDEVYKCPECNKTSIRKESITFHIRKYHKNYMNKMLVEQELKIENDLPMCTNYLRIQKLRTINENHLKKETYSEDLADSDEILNSENNTENLIKNINLIELNTEEQNIFYCPIKNCKHHTIDKINFFFHLHESHDLVQCNQNLDFQCFICGMTHQRKELVKRHLKKTHFIITTIVLDEHEDAVLKCPKCMAIFQEKKFFTGHLRKNHKHYFIELLIQQQLKFEKDYPQFNTNNLYMSKLKENNSVVDYISEEYYFSNEDDELVSQSIENEFQDKDDVYYCPLSSCTFNTKIKYNIFMHLHQNHELFQHNELNLNYECNFCSLTSIDHESIKNHLRKEHNILTTIPVNQKSSDKNFNCPECNNISKTEEHFNNHLRIYHTKYFNTLLTEEQLSYEKLHSNFNTNYLKTKNTAAYTANKITVYWGDEVDLNHSIDSEMTQNEYLEDISNSSNQKNFNCPAKDCNYSSKINHKEVYKHILENHELVLKKDEKYLCFICDIGYNKRDSIQIHLKREHGLLTTIIHLLSDEDNFKCPVCLLSYAGRQSLSTHLKNYHKDYYNDFLCQEQVKYEQVHSQFIIECMNSKRIEYCNRIRTEEYIRDVNNLETENNENIEFVEKLSTKNHITSLSMENGEFHCPIIACNYISSNLLNIFSHTLTDHKLFSCSGRLCSCSICNTTLSKPNMVRHMKMTHGIITKNTAAFLKPPYKCPKCVKIFQRQQFLNIHIEQVHVEYFNALLIEQQKQYISVNPQFFNECSEIQSNKEDADYSEQINDEASNNDSVICPIANCTETKKNKLEIFLHIFDNHKLIDRSENEYICTICDEKSRKRNLVVRHLQVYHGVLCNLNMESLHGKVLKCSQCNESCDGKSSLNIHLRKYHIKFFNEELAKQQIRFVNSDLIFKNNIIDIEHIRQRAKQNKKMHAESIKLNQKTRFLEKDGQWRCQICDEVKNSYRLISNHYRHKHVSHSVCDICGKQYSAAKNLEIHRLTHFEPKFSCEHCGKKFVREVVLKNHLKIHLGIKNHQCDYCDKKCHTKSDKRLHEKIVHLRDRSHQCHLCGRGFYTTTRLKYHMRRHTNDKQFECEICGHRFFSNAALSHHRVLHSSLRPFECDICHSSFKLKKYLRTHMNLKHKQCIECGITFTRFSQRNDHKDICGK